MYIIYIGKDRHSAWACQSDAIKQKKVLQEFGYKGITIKYNADSQFPDGFYFV